MMHKIMVVGGGSIGERHVRCLLATGRAKVNLCEVNKGLLETVAGRYGLDGKYEDFDAVDLSKFDGVLIATPAHLHIAQGRKVVAAGVNLYCEKPLTVRDEGVRELIKEIEQAKVVAGVGFTWRYMPLTDVLSGMLKDGRVGELKHMTIWAGQNFPSRRPAYKQVYYADPRTGGGAILDGMSHLVSLLQVFAGKVHSVYGMYYSSELLEVPVEDTVDVLMEFAGGVKGNIHLNQWQRNSETEIMLRGSGGTARYSAERNAVGICDQIDGPWQEKIMKSERDDYYIAEANNFMNAIEGKEKVRCTVEEAYHINKVCWAIRESCDQGRRIEIAD